MDGHRKRALAGQAVMWLIAVGVGLWAASTSLGEPASSKLPPIGQRKYVLDEKNPYAPVAIQEKGKVVKQTFLKDPIQSKSQVKPVVIRRSAPATPKKVVKQTWAPSQLKFNKLAVRGHLMRPRVEFDREILPVGRSDEPTRQDFFQKVFEPVRDDNF